MTPDSPCASLVAKNKDCGHALKWHNPCSKCPCQAFTPTQGALDEPGEAVRLPDGSITAQLLASGRVTPSGIVIPRGAREVTVSATLAGVFLKGTAAARPAANAVAGGTVYSATDTGVITQSDGSSWSTWATISAGLADPMTTRGDIIVRGAASTTRLALGTAGKALVSDGTDVVWGSPGVTGQIVQVKTANLASDHSTTAATMQDSGLSLAFTPLFADSILHVNVDGECQCSRVAGTLVERYQWVGILNSTDAVELVRNVRGGRGPAAGSADLLTQFNPIALKGLYTVNSLAARTFKLQHMAGVVTNIESTMSGGRTGGVTMTIREVRP